MEAFTLAARRNRGLRGGEAAARILSASKEARFPPNLGDGWKEAIPFSFA